MRWNRNVLRVAMTALLVACVHTPKTASASPPPTGHRLIRLLERVGTTRPMLIPRTAWVYIPASYSNATAPVSLIVNFHGDGSSGRRQEARSRMSATADLQPSDEVFLVAYPNANSVDENGRLKWNDDATSRAGIEDRKFIYDLVTTLETDYPKLDRTRVYATGMSNGGGMTNRVGCDMADTFAAIAPVEGGYADWTQCNPTQHISVMAFHGVTDHVVPYCGGMGAGPAAGCGPFPCIPEWAATWANRDSCDANPGELTVLLQLTPVTAITRQEWTHCADDASVVLYAIDPHNHTWPDPTVIDANEKMWEFFRAHPKQP